MSIYKLSNYMYCESCGAEVGENDAFCHNCGVNINYSDDAKSKGSNSSVKDELLKFTYEWKTWSGKKKILSLIACCCLGWIVVSAIMGVLIPDADTSEEYQSSYDSNVGSVDSNSTTLESSSVSHISSDDSSLSVSSSSVSESTDSSSSSESSYGEDSSGSSGSESYVGNINTKKFHYSYCSSAGQMKDSHKIYFSSRDDAISSGYVPCKRCNP